MTITFDSTSLAFGSCSVGTTTTKQVTVSNSSTTGAVSLTAPGSPFSMTPSPASVPAGGSTTVSITFKPTATGSYTDYIIGDAQQIQLTGTGVDVVITPSSFDFGEVAVGSSSSWDLTLSNAGTAAVTATLSGSGFAMSPSPASVPAGDTLTVTITFTPTSETSYSASLTASTATGSLTGTGVDEVTDSTTQESLYFEVPSFASSVFEASRATSANTVTMSTFLRLGTFDFTKETTKSKELLTYIHQAGGPGDPSRGDTLGTWAWDSSTGDFTTVPPLQARTTSAAADDAGNRDVFWLDDVRKHDVDVNPSIPDSAIVGHGLTMAQRQAESARLYSRGGWRDHTDGNRVTTTYGDKVEVIRGNYKMVVMGRQNDPTNAMGWEVSGDQVGDYAYGSTSGVGYWCEFVPDYQFVDNNGVQRTGVWLVVNSTENVYEYARYSGNFREERWGNVLETYVGSSNPPSTAVAQDSTYGTGGHEPPTRLSGVSYDYPSGDASQHSVPGWSDDNDDIVRLNPHIIEKTWAQRIDSWRGSSDCRVPIISEKTFAEETDSEIDVSGSVTEKLTAKSHTSTTKISGSKHENLTAGSMVYNTSCSGEMKTVTEADNIWVRTTLENDWYEVQQIPTTKTEIVMAGLRTEVLLAGLQTAIGVHGISTEVCVSGIKLAADIAILKVEMAVGVCVEIENFKYSFAQMKGGIATIKDSVTTLWKTITAPRVDLGLAPPDPAAAAAVAQGAAAAPAPPPVVAAGA